MERWGNMGPKGDAEQRTAAHMFTEPWIVRPLTVNGTAASDNQPGIDSALPECFQEKNSTVLQEDSKLVTGMTVQFLSDKGSGNLLYYKQRAVALADLIPPGTNVCHWYDNCISHAQHRCKVPTPRLKYHTMRLFSIAKNSKRESEQQRLVTYLQTAVPRKVRRIVGPPPPLDDSKTSLAAVSRILFDTDAKYHQRKDGRLREKIYDITEFARFANGDLQSRFIEHYCWCVDSQRPCCRSSKEAAEKAFILANNPCTLR